jgi:cell division protein FtsL
MVTAPRTAARPAVPTLATRIPVIFLAMLLLTVVTLTGLLQVLQSSRTSTIGYEMRQFEVERATLSAEVRLLEAEIAQISVIDQIRQQAIERLGMVEPEQTLQIAVTTPAPTRIPVPERYISWDPASPLAPAAWWEQLLNRLPGFN